jgi:hypothetical protein
MRNFIQGGYMRKVMDDIEDVVETIISRCSDCLENDETGKKFNRHIHTDLSFLKMDCLLDCLFKMSNGELKEIKDSKGIINALQKLKNRLKEYIYINESDVNLIALKEKLKDVCSESSDFGDYFRNNIKVCKECWDGHAEDHSVVRTYLATILLIYATDVFSHDEEPITAIEILNSHDDGPITPIELLPVFLDPVSKIIG